MFGQRRGTTCRVIVLLFLLVVLVAEWYTISEVGSKFWQTGVLFKSFRFASIRTISADDYRKAMFHLRSMRSQANRTKLYLKDAQLFSPLPSDIDNSSVYWRFVFQINDAGLYEDTPQSVANAEPTVVDELVHALGHVEIATLRSEDRTGTEFKFTATFKDGSAAIMKPMRYARDQQVPPNRYYFSEEERHHSEIAAYHLDRILGFNSVPPCSGRILNITTQILPVSDDAFISTVYQAPNGNWCFYGRCMYFCDIQHPFCGSPDAIEFSVCTMIPFKHWQSLPVMSPWRRSYSTFLKARWQEAQFNASYCPTLLRNNTRYKDGKRIFQLVDLAVFDFLMGNQDRHHYELFKTFNHSFVTFDNGRGFGRHSVDDMWIIAPLFQCCKIRRSTYETLHFFETNTSLSSLMQHSLSHDPANKNGPLLSDNHLKSLDRRVKILLELVHRCESTLGGFDKVFNHDPND